MTQIRKAGSNKVAADSEEAQRIETTHGFGAALKRRQAREDKQSAAKAKGSGKPKGGKS